MIIIIILLIICVIYSLYYNNIKEHLDDAIEYKNLPLLSSIYNTNSLVKIPTLNTAGDISCQNLTCVGEINPLQISANNDNDINVTTIGQDKYIYISAKNTVVKNVYNGKAGNLNVLGTVNVAGNVTLNTVYVRK